jgi:hypothetical protein
MSEKIAWVHIHGFTSSITLLKAIIICSFFLLEEVSRKFRSHDLDKSTRSAIASIVISIIFGFFAWSRTI